MEAVSIVQSIKSVVGMESAQPTCDCVDCGASFERTSDPDSDWFQCPECGSEDPLGDDEGA